MDLNDIAKAVNEICPIKTDKKRPYPFIYETEFREQLQANDELAMLSFLMQYRLQEEFEVNERRTVNKNGRGFMNSHEKYGTLIAEAILSGGEVFMPPGGFKADGLRFQDQISYALHVGRRYAASTLRATLRVIVSEDEELAKKAATFNIKP